MKMFGRLLPEALEDIARELTREEAQDLSDILFEIFDVQPRNYAENCWQQNSRKG